MFLALWLVSAAPAQDFLKMDPDELPLVQAEPNESPFMLGPAAGYMRTRDADEGSWYVGLMARLKVTPFLAVEGMGAFRQHDFTEGAIRFTQYPVQLSALIFPFSPPDILRPYALAGAGWYPTQIEYRGPLDARDDESDTLFGIHIGAGAELQLGPSLVANIDLRWIFMDEPDVDNSAITDEEFDTWQVAVGVGFQF
jgi:opacity protein-like surface antigen